MVIILSAMAPAPFAILVTIFGVVVFVLVATTATATGFFVVAGVIFLVIFFGLVIFTLATTTLCSRISMCVVGRVERLMYLEGLE